jgi:predicted RNase H-like HicB family nuclease
MHAIALIHEENGTFGISFPDFPGCVSTGRSLDDVLLKGAQALGLHVAGMVEEGEAAPVLRSASQLRADPEFRDDFEGATVAAISVELPRRAVRVNISIDEGLLERVDRAAESGGRAAALDERVSPCHHGREYAGLAGSKPVLLRFSSRFFLSSGRSGTS